MRMISEEFISPAGWGTFLVYDEEACEIYARICDDGEWDPDGLGTEDLEHLEEGERWCLEFGYRYCDSYVEAQWTAHECGTRF